MLEYLPNPSCEEKDAKALWSEGQKCIDDAAKQFYEDRKRMFLEEIKPEDTDWCITFQKGVTINIQWANNIAISILFSRSTV